VQRINTKSFLVNVNFFGDAKKVQIRIIMIIAHDAEAVKMLMERWDWI